jgi:hypothetical protein
LPDHFRVRAEYSHFTKNLPADTNIVYVRKISGIKINVRILY